jgi:hypothetical protein
LRAWHAAPEGNEIELKENLRPWLEGQSLRKFTRLVGRPASVRSADRILARITVRVANLT